MLAPNRGVYQETEGVNCETGHRVDPRAAYDPPLLYVQPEPDGG